MAKATSKGGSEGAGGGYRARAHLSRAEPLDEPRVRHLARVAAARGARASVHAEFVQENVSEQVHICAFCALRAIVQVRAALRATA